VLQHAPEYEQHIFAQVGFTFCVHLHSAPFSSETILQLAPDEKLPDERCCSLHLNKGFQYSDSLEEWIRSTTQCMHITLEAGEPELKQLIRLLEKNLPSLYACKIQLSALQVLDESLLLLVVGILPRLEYLREFSIYHAGSLSDESVVWLWEWITTSPCTHSELKCLIISGISLSKILLTILRYLPLNQRNQHFGNTIE
jgi:hypothetical protein